MEALEKFISTISQSLETEAVLLLSEVSPGLFDSLNAQHTGGVADLILGEYTFGKPDVSLDLDSRTIRVKDYWAKIHTALAKLSSNGIGVFVTLDDMWSTRQGAQFIEELEASGAFLEAIIKMPPNLLQGTALQPYLSIWSRRASSTIFLGELANADLAVSLAENFINSTGSDSQLDGVLVPRADFSGYKNFESNQRIERLVSQYKNYQRYVLEDFAIGVNAIRSGEAHEPIGNCIYLPKIGTAPAVANDQERRMKDQNYYQVPLQENVLAEYLAAYFDSELGREILVAARRGATILQMPRSAVRTLEIAVPDMGTQLRIVEMRNRLESLKGKIERLEKEFAVSPDSSWVVDETEQFEKVLDRASEEQILLAAIRSGESKTMEFKQTLELDVQSGDKRKELRIASLKTIVGFLNSDGGRLFVGVADDGSVFGIEEEIEKFHRGLDDKFLLHFKNLFKSAIGEQFYPIVDYDIRLLSGKKVLLVSCTKSNHPCYLNGQDFYVRTNPATDKLEGPSLVDYVRERFPN